MTQTHMLDISLYKSSQLKLGAPKNYLTYPPQTPPFILYGPTLSLLV